MRVKKLPLIALAVLSLIFVACDSKKPNTAVSDSDSTLQLTADAVLPAADGPGIYARLAVNGSRYQLFEKYLSEDDVFLTEGKLSQHGDSLILDDDRVIVGDGKGKWTMQGVAMRRCADKPAPASLGKQFWKDDATGIDMEITFLTRDNARIALVNMDGKSEQLALDPNQEDEVYANKQMKIKKDDDKLTLTLNGKTSTATLVNPAFMTLTAADGSVFDYVMTDDGTQAFALLLGDSTDKCFILPRSEASAKTAVFSQDKVTLELLNDGSAKLTKDGKTTTLRVKKD